MASTPLHPPLMHLHYQSNTNMDFPVQARHKKGRPLLLKGDPEAVKSDWKGLRSNEEDLKDNEKPLKRNKEMLTGKEEA